MELLWGLREILAEDWQASDSYIKCSVNTSCCTKDTVSGRDVLFFWKKVEGAVLVDKWKHHVPFCTGSGPVPYPEERGRNSQVCDASTHRWELSGKVPAGWPWFSQWRRRRERFPHQASHAVPEFSVGFSPFPAPCNLSGQGADLRAEMND